MTRAPERGGIAEKRAAYRRGRGAEAIAALLLRAKGYRILARGYRCAVGEVDIVARRGNTLVAVEVKARETLDAAAEAIAPRQRRRIVRAVSDYLARHSDYASCDIRFDAILVSPRWRPRHIADAWRPGGEE